MKNDRVAAVSDRDRFRRITLWIPIALLLVAGVLYFRTLAPVVTFVDSGELAAAIATHGVSHPSGSPLYLLLGAVAAAVPAGSLIWRLNAFSAVCSALCVGLSSLYLIRGREPVTAPVPKKKEKRKKEAVVAPTSQSIFFVPWSAAVAAGLAMMTNRALWNTATVTEVYALHALLIVLLALLLEMHAREARRVDGSPGQWFLGAAAFVAGLGASNYPPFGIVGPAVLVVLWRIEGRSFPLRWRRNLLMVVCFAAGLLPYILLPLRAATDPLLNWGNPSNWERFWKHISAQQYTVFLGSPRFSALPDALKLWGTQWPIGILLLIPPGIYFLRRVRPVSFVFTVVLGATNLLYVLCYDITDVSSAPSDYYTYLLPLCWCSAIWIGAGLGWILQWFKDRRFSLAAATVIALVPAVSIPLHWEDMDRSHYTYADDFARGILQSLAPGAILLSPDWTFVSPSMYLQLGEHFRTDVLVLDGELLRRSWYLPFIRKRFPDLGAACDPAIGAFLAELTKYEEGLPYDGNVITQKYVAMLNGLMEQGLRLNHPVYILLNLEAKESHPDSFRAIEQQLRRPPYFTTGVSPEAIGNGFQWVPETMAFRLYRDDLIHTFPEVRVPPRPLEPGKVYDNVTDGVIERYADFWRYRGDYRRMAAGDCAGAVVAYRLSLDILQQPEAQAGLSACSR